MPGCGCSERGRPPRQPELLPQQPQLAGRHRAAAEEEDQHRVQRQDRAREGLQPEPQAHQRGAADSVGHPQPGEGGGQGLVLQQVTQENTAKASKKLLRRAIYRRQKDKQSSPPCGISPSPPSGGEFEKHFIVSIKYSDLIILRILQNRESYKVINIYHMIKGPFHQQIQLKIILLIEIKLCSQYIRILNDREHLTVLCLHCSDLLLAARPRPHVQLLPVPLRPRGGRVPAPPRHAHQPRPLPQLRPGPRPRVRLGPRPEPRPAPDLLVLFLGVAQLPALPGPPHLLPPHHQPGVPAQL